jgi:hypothetical protein
MTDGVRRWCAHDRLGPVLVELGLDDPDRLGEVLVRQFRVDDLVAVLRQVGGLHAAWNGLPAVEEEDSHGIGPYPIIGFTANTRTLAA